MFALPPLSLYIHIPWCIRKCHYCDFNSHTSPTKLPEAEYVSALLNDLAADASLAQGRPIASIFFGGGTPSLFSASAIANILAGVAQHLTLAPNLEITLEANPGTVEFCDFGDLASAGINRLSLGVQSFNTHHLAQLGRIHSADEARRAFTLARAGGIRNINLDLMHGLPQQTPAQAVDDLQQALDLAPEHISWYQLTIEPNTVFFNRPPKLPEDDALADIQDAGEVLLAGAGFAQYEVSAYARAGKQAVHNLNYWQFGDYLVLGAGAHGKITHRHGGVQRYWKTRLPQDYLAADKQFTAGHNWVAPEQLPFEFMLNALRLPEGVPSRLFAERTGLLLNSIAAPLTQLRAQGLLQTDLEVLAPTALGLRFLNEVVARFDTVT